MIHVVSDEASVEVFVNWLVWLRLARRRCAGLMVLLMYVGGDGFVATLGSVPVSAVECTVVVGSGVNPGGTGVVASLVRVLKMSANCCSA